MSTQAITKHDIPGIAARTLKGQLNQNGAFHYKSEWAGFLTNWTLIPATSCPPTSSSCRAGTPAAFSMNTPSCAGQCTKPC